MDAPRQVENPFYRSIGRQHGRGLGELAQVIGKTAIPFLRGYIVPAAKRMSADLLEFAVLESTEVVSGRKTAAKSVGTQTLRKQLGSVRWKSNASRVIPTKSKSSKQISRSRRDIFTNISHYSCRVIFVTNLLWQILEILQGKSQ